MNCFFCGERLATKSDPPFELCDRCHKEREEVQEKLKQPLINESKKDVGPLCLRCGVCCFMLSARCTDEEAERIEKDHGVSVDRLTHIEALGPNEGKRVLKVPCRLLQGRPLDHAFCKAYKGFRPEVCHSYFCKIAQRYSLGMLSYHEALFWLRTAMITGDVSIFNWTSSGSQDDRLVVAGMISTFADNLRDIGASQEHINLAVAEKVTPRYFFRSAPDRLAIEMHLSAFDRGDVDPTLFIAKDKVASWDPTVRQFAVEVVRAVMEEIRSHFDKENSSLTEMLQKLKAEDERETESEDNQEHWPKESTVTNYLTQAERVDNVLDWMSLVMAPEEIPRMNDLTELAPDQLDEVVRWCEQIVMNDGEGEPGSAPECLRDLLPDGAYYKDWRLIHCAICGRPMGESGCDCGPLTIN